MHKSDSLMRLLRLPKVLARVGLGRSTALELIKRGEFPAPIKIGAIRVWEAGQIDHWIRAQVDATTRQKTGG